MKKKYYEPKISNLNGMHLREHNIIPAIAAVAAGAAAQAVVSSAVSKAFSEDISLYRPKFLKKVDVVYE